MYLRFLPAFLALALATSVRAQPNNAVLEEEINPVTPPIAFNDVGTAKSYRRGASHTIQWAGGDGSEKMRLEVYRDGGASPVLVQTVDSGFENSNALTFSLSSKLKPGKNRSYYFLLSKENGDATPVRSQSFTVARKMPLYLKIAIPVVAVTGIILLLNSNKGGSDPNSTGIVDPPKPSK